MSAALGLGDLLDMANRSDPALAGRIDHGLLRPDAPLPDTPFDAVVFPPNLTGVRGQADTRLHSWIRQQHRNGATLCSACAGAFWLGHAGVLDGRPVTTHWALEPEFRATFPDAQLHPEHLLIDDHDVVTAGGVMAWIDLGLYLVKRWHGPETVTRTCRQMLIDPQGREQRNYRSFRPDLTHKDDAIRTLQRWMEGNIAADLTIHALARRAALSDRSLQRRFTKATGLSVSRYIQELRIEKARGLLERTTMPISEICWKVGYEDLSAFSRLFKTISGLSAGDYRKRFSVR